MVGRADPLTWTTDPVTNPDPLTVRVKLDPNTSAVAGEMFEIEGTGLRTARVFAGDVPPPGEGLKTVIDRLAPLATSAAEICAVNWVPLTNVVVRLAPFTCTTEPGMKLLPLRVNVKPALPALTLLGEMLASEGCGLLMVRVTAAEVPPPGVEFTTVIETEPTEAMSLAGIAALSWLPLTNVVVRLEPLTLTTELETKLLPFSVSVNAGLPALTLAGEMLTTDG